MTVTTTDLLDPASWLGQRWDRFEFEIVDRDYTLVGLLSPTTDGSPTIQVSTERAIMRSLGGLELLATDRDALDPIRHRIRPMCILSTGDRFPLGVFIIGDRQVSVSTRDLVGHPSCFDQGHILDQPLDRSVGLAVGQNCETTFINLVNEVGIFHVDLATAPGTTTVEEAIAWPAGRSRYEVLTHLASLMGCLRPFFNNAGVLRTVLTPVASSINIDAVYGPGRIVADSIIETDDSYRAPNRYVAIGSGSEVPIVGIYDVPTGAPHSAANRGFVVAEVVDAPGVSSEIEAQAIARSTYLTDARSWNRVSFEGLIDPRNDIFSVMRYERAGQAGIYLEVGFRQVLRWDGTHTHDLARLWDVTV